MGSFHRPIGEPDPYEGYKAERIEADKRGRESMPPEKPPHFFALLFSFLKRLLEFLPFVHKGSSAGSVRTALEKFKRSLDELKQEDRSEDDPFLQNLSELWGQIHSLDQREVREVIQALHRYPPNQEHTLGYYLSETSGERWFPVPYRKLIEGLYLEHQTNASNSHLTQWIRLLDKALQHLPLVE